MIEFSLNGLWEFFILTEGTDVNLCCCPYTVVVPGSWRETPGLENYEGAGLYRHRFMISGQQAEMVGLICFAGAFRSAEVYLNRVFAGEHRGFQAPFEIDVTGKLRAGENVVEVRVDSRRPKGELFGLGSVFELVPFHFDGLFRGVTLCLSERTAAEGLYTLVEGDTALFLFDIRSAEFTRAVIEYSVSDVSGTICVGYFKADLIPGIQQVRHAQPLHLFSLWSPETPVLYDVKINVTCGGKSDQTNCRTGFKHLETRGRVFRLNGDPYYLLGYGDDFVFPGGFPFTADKTFYYYGLRRAKAYGFNEVRCHSHVPFDAFLDAADEIGMLVQPELALANIPREMLTPENSVLYLKQWEEMIRAFRKHPCIAIWCGGNEMEWGYPFSSELYRKAKELDPYRPVQSTDGNFMSCDVDETFDCAGICPAEYTDYLPYRELNGMFMRDDCGKPQTVHEMGNYTTVYDIRELTRYTEYKPSKLKHMTEIAAGAMKERYEIAYRNSLSLQKLCHKLNIEKARLSPYFCGYHVWTLTDFYDLTQGILNAFYEDKAFTAEEFASFNRQSVLLWDHESVVFRAGEKVRIKICLSRYGSGKPLEGTLTLRLSTGACLREARRFAGHGPMEAAVWEVSLPDADREMEYTLSASFEGENIRIENKWSLFAVPQVRLHSDKEIYIHYLSRHLVEGAGVPVRHFTIPQPIGSEQLIITDCLYGGMLEAVERGSSMLLLTRPGMFKHMTAHNSFKSPWWEQGKIWYLNASNNAQISCQIEDHPANSMLPYHGSWKLDLFGLVEQADAVDLDELGLDVQPLIYGFSTELHRMAYVFTFALEKGKVTVCSLNHSRKDITDPAVDYVLKSLINKCMSDDYVPEKKITRQLLTGVL